MLEEMEARITKWGYVNEPIRASNDGVRMQHIRRSSLWPRQPATDNFVSRMSRNPLRSVGMTIVIIVFGEDD
jgi:hypothetical protein